ncbi:UNVERIFIED_CONTAM: dienelactone hydrolase family protein [Williamsia faeni]
MSVTGYRLGGQTALRSAELIPGRVTAALSFRGGGLVTDDANSPHLLADRIAATIVVAGAETTTHSFAEQADALDAALT